MKLNYYPNIFANKQTLIEALFIYTDYPHMLELYNRIDHRQFLFYKLQDITRVNLYNDFN